jgi:hypothetical protein
LLVFTICAWAVRCAESDPVVRRDPTISPAITIKGATGQTQRVIELNAADVTSRRKHALPVEPTASSPEAPHLRKRSSVDAPGLAGVKGSSISETVFLSEMSITSAGLTVSHFIEAEFAR